MDLAQQTSDAAAWPFQVVYMLLFFGPWLYALVHAIKHGESEFKQVDSSKTLWIVLLIMTTIFAAVPYLFTVHRRLNRLRAAWRRFALDGKTTPDSA